MNANEPKSWFGAATTTTMLIAAITATVRADGLIHALPPDGSWVEYELAGEGTSARRGATVKLKGTLILKSVGREQIDGADCRWIEIESVVEFDAGDRKGKQTEAQKVLIPEKFLTSGNDPRAHVLKAWSKSPDGTVRAMPLKSSDARGPQALADELFHGTLPHVEERAGIELETPGGTFQTTLVDGKDTVTSGDSETVFLSKTWKSDKAPFGVVAYRYDKSRRRAGAVEGSRWMELKLSKTGTDAKTAINPQ